VAGSSSAVEESSTKSSTAQSSAQLSRHDHGKRPWIQSISISRRRLITIRPETQLNWSTCLIGGARSNPATTSKQQTTRQWGPKANEEMFALPAGGSRVTLMPTHRAPHNECSSHNFHEPQMQTRFPRPMVEEDDSPHLLPVGRRGRRESRFCTNLAGA